MIASLDFYVSCLLYSDYQKLSLLFVVDLVNNISIEDRFHRPFSVETGISLIIFGGFLDSVFIYCIWSSGLWSGSRMPLFKKNVMSR